MGDRRVPDPTRYAPTRVLLDMLNRAFMEKHYGLVSLPVDLDHRRPAGGDGVRDVSPMIPTLFEVVDDGSALAHAQYKVAYYRYILMRCREYEPREVALYIKNLCLHKIKKWRAIETRLLPP